jgi:hypothetical protein
MKRDALLAGWSVLQQCHVVAARGDVEKSLAALD